MRELIGKCAFITGGSGGIGLGIARALAGAGVRLALAGLSPSKLDAAADDLRKIGADVVTFQLDVSDRAAVYRAAEDAEQALGKIHILANNAGVGFAGARLDKIRDEDWDWVIGTNLFGVVNCLQAFIPRIKRHGEGGHVVNTSSISGLFVTPVWAQGVYSTTKYAIVGLSEALAHDLAPYGIDVSVLCPAGVNTDIYQSGRNRPDRFGGAFTRPMDHPLNQAAANGMSPDLVGQRVLRAIENNEFYIITHPETREGVESRHRRLMEAYDLAETLATGK